MLPMKLRKVLAASSLVIILSDLAIAAEYFYNEGYRFNFTKSAPMGLYRISEEKPQKGDWVAFCLASSNPFSVLAKERKYLGQGSCPNGLKPLLKRLVAGTGDYIVATPQYIRVNRHFLADSAWRAADSRGRPMPESLLIWNNWSIIKPGMCLVMSGLNMHTGFDSRYFGLIDEIYLLKVELILNFYL
jgi:conjugative transfer signal peptidase TraF